MSYITVEKGEVERHLHLQGVVVLNTTSPKACKISIFRALGYGAKLEKVPQGLKISLRSLTQKGLHTPIGIIGYARKDRALLHFKEIVRHNVSDQDLEDGDHQYLLHGKAPEMKKRADLNPFNLLNRMMLYFKYNSKLVADSHDPLGLLLSMVQSGSYNIPLSWIYGGSTHGLDLARFGSVWKCNIMPEDVKIDDLLKVMFPQSTFHGLKSPQDQEPDLFETLQSRILSIDEGDEDAIDEGDEDVACDPIHFGDLMAQCHQDLAMQRKGIYDPLLPVPKGLRYFENSSDREFHDVQGQRKSKAFRSASAFNRSLMSVRGARAQDSHVKHFTALLTDPFFNNADIHTISIGPVDPYTSMDAIDASMKVCDETLFVSGEIVKDGDVFAQNYDHVFLAQLPPR